MDERTFHLLVDKINKLEESLKDDIKELKENVNELLRFKWKVAGMAMVVGVVSAAIFEVIVALIKINGG